MVRRRRGSSGRAWLKAELRYPLFAEKEREREREREGERGREREREL